MKLKYLLTVGLMTLLVSCNDINQTDTSESTPQVEQTDEHTYMLGYGDYFTTVSKEYKTEKLKNIYEDLCEEVSSDKSDIIQEVYQQGLIDFFDINNKVKITLSTSKDELLTINDYHRKNNKESYRFCDLDIQMNDFIFHYEDVGFRLKGNTSRGIVVNDDNSLQLRHYKLRFNEEFDDEFRDDEYIFEDDNAKDYRKDRTFFGLEKLDIRWNKNEDQTYIKELYAYEMYRENGMLAAHTTPFNLQFNIDGNIENCGVYLAVEPIDKDFLKRNVLKEYNSGDLYKMGWTNEGAKLNDLSPSLFGVESQEKDGNGFKSISYNYDLKTNKKTSTHSDIMLFIRKLNNTAASNYINMLRQYSDYERIIKYFAIAFLLGDPDDLRGNFNNTYLYFIPNEEGYNKAMFIPTDHDRALGSTGGSEPLGHHGVLNSPFECKTGYSENDMPLYQKSIFIKTNQEIRNDYLKQIENVINAGWLDIEKFKTYYDIAMANYNDCTKLGTRFVNNDVSFSLIENDDIYNSWNLSIEKYFNEKKNTLKDYVNII